MLLADVKEEEAPIDPFKQTRVKQEKKDSVTEKVNNTKYFKGNTDNKEIDPSKTPTKHGQKFTT